jgi:hypothetical protein
VCFVGPDIMSISINVSSKVFIFFSSSLSLIFTANFTSGGCRRKFRNLSPRKEF